MKKKEKLKFPKIKTPKENKGNKCINPKNSLLVESIELKSEPNVICSYNENFKINLSLTTKNILKEGVNNAIHEYLIKNNLNETLKVFQKEIFVSKTIEIENFAEKMKNEFKNGNKSDFFNLWCKYIPLSLRVHDKNTIITEFFMNIYFSLYSIHPNFHKYDQKDDYKFSLKNFHRVIKDFQKYLICQGDELTKIEELLPYFALPYMKEPHNHPLFKNLFSENFVKDMEHKLDLFLHSFYNNESQPVLLEIYQQFIENKKFDAFKNKKNLKNEFLKNGKKSEVLDYIKKLENDNFKLMSIIEDFQAKTQQKEKKFHKNKKVEKKVSLQIQKKWAVFTEEIINLSKSLYDFAKNFVQGNDDFLNKVNFKLKEFQNFLQINKTDLNNNFSSFSNKEEISLDFFKNNLSKVVKKNFIFLDVKKIKKDLLTNKDPIKKDILLNLKEIFYNCSEYEIRTFSILLLEEDFFDFENNKENNSYSLMNKNEELKIIFFEILNKLSLDYVFRGSLTKNEQLIKNLIKILEVEKNDSNFRRIALALLQKISLRRKAQNIMLENKVIEMVFDKLKNEENNLSDFSKEYFLTLLMNLSLNLKGKKIFEKDQKFIYVNLLLKLLKNCSYSQRHFINGIIYSILLSKKIRKMALENNIEDVLMSDYAQLDNKFQKQLDFIKERLYQQIEEFEFKMEDYGDIDNLYTIEAIFLNKNIKNANNKMFFMNYQLLNTKELDSLKAIVCSYFSLFFKNTDNNINFDVTVDNEQPLQRPSTPSYFSVKEQSFNKYTYTKEIDESKKSSQYLENNKSYFSKYHKEQSDKSEDEFKNDDATFENEMNKSDNFEDNQNLIVRINKSDGVIAEQEILIKNKKGSFVDETPTKKYKEEIEKENKKKEKESKTEFFELNCSEKKEGQENKISGNIEWKEGFESKPLLERTPFNLK